MCNKQSVKTFAINIYIFVHVINKYTFFCMKIAGNCFFLKDVSVYDNDSLGTVVYHGLVAGHNVGEGQQLACS